MERSHPFGLLPSATAEDGGAAASMQSARSPEPTPGPPPVGAAARQPEDAACAAASLPGESSNSLELPHPSAKRQNFASEPPSGFRSIRASLTEELPVLNVLGQSHEQDAACAAASLPRESSDRFEMPRPSAKRSQRRASMEKFTSAPPGCAPSVRTSLTEGLPVLLGAPTCESEIGASGLDSQPVGSGSEPARSTNTRGSWLSVNSCARTSSTRDSRQGAESARGSVALRRSRLSSRSRLWTTSSTRASALAAQGLEFETASRRESLKASESQDCCRGVRALVRSRWFEMFTNAAIVANCIVMCVDAQHRGLQVESAVKQGGPIDGDLQDAWPGAGVAFIALDWIFGVTFTLELSLRLAADRLDFFLLPWRWLDLAIVSLLMIETLGRSMLPVNPSILRVVRVLRLLRVLRLVHQIQAFDSLCMLITALKASMATMAGSLCVVLLVQMVVALALMHSLEPALLDGDRPHELRCKVYRYFGTFSKSMLSTFELAIGNWPDCSRVLTENVGDGYIIFVLGYQCLVGFAVVRVVMGVFLRVTMDVAANDDTLMLTQRDRAKKVHARKMHALFKAADRNADGYLERNEFRKLVEDPRVGLWLAAMQCDLRSAGADRLFDMLAHGEPGLTVDHLTAGAAGISGVARAVDLAVLRQEGHATRALLQELSAELGSASTPRRCSTQTRSPRTSKLVAKARTSALAADASRTSSHSTDSLVELREELQSPELQSRQEAHGSRNSQTDARPPPRQSMCHAQSTGTTRGLQIFGTSRSVTGNLLGGDEASRGWSGQLRTLLLHPGTKLAMSVLILCSGAGMAAEAQFRGMEIGRRLGYPGLEGPATETWPAAKAVLEGLEWAVGAALAAELALRVLVFGRCCILQAWGRLDALVVVLWAAGRLWRLLSDGADEPSPLRLARTLRLVRLVQALEVFDGLYTMTSAIRGSMRAIPWSWALILLVATVVAITVGSAVTPAMLDATIPLEEREQLYRYFGTYTKALLTALELSLANWSPASRVLVETVGEGWTVFAIGHKLTMGFAVVTVITGILLQETGQVAQNDDVNMISSVDRKARRHTEKMTRLFREADANGTGLIDAKSFRKVANDERVSSWLSAMGLEMGDPEALFWMVARPGCNQVSAEELVSGVALLKGPARSVDLAEVLRERRELCAMAKELRDALHQAVAARAAALRPTGSQPVNAVGSA